MGHRRLAVVTGGSSGIGAATAAALAADGWRVVLVARGAEALHEVRDRIVAAGGDAVAEPLDASDGDAVIALADRVLEDHGVPEAIVNSAGAGEWRLIHETPPDLAVQMMSAPYQAAYNMTHAFIAPMVERDSGVLIHVGSPASVAPWPGATAYTAARWALRGLHESLRQDLSRTGVRSCHVMFAEVSTPYFEKNQVPREHLPKLNRWVPVTTPRECARVIVDTIERPRAQVLHPRSLRALYLQYRMVPALGRRFAAWGARRH
jgi:uncharacterized protein